MGGVELASLKYFPLYLRYARTLRSLKLDQLGLVLLAGIQYAEDGTLPEMDPEVTVAMGFICEDIDQAQASYDDLCETNRRNINRRWKRDGDTDVYDGIRSNTTVYDGYQVNEMNVKEREVNTDLSLHADGQRTESPGKGPTLEDVRSFVRQNGLNVDPDDYHEKRTRSGWRNKTGRYVGGDWQSDVRKWSRYQRETVAPKPEKDSESSVPRTSFDTDSFFEAALRASDARWEADVNGETGEEEQ